MKVIKSEFIKILRQPIRIGENYMLSLTDAARGCNAWRSEHDMPPFNLSQWLTNASTRRLMDHIAWSFRYVTDKSQDGIWGHPSVFYHAVLAACPDFRIEDEPWLYSLLRHTPGGRNEDSYARMCGYLYLRTTDKARFHVKLCSINAAIEAACKFPDQRFFIYDQMVENLKIIWDVDEALRLSLA